MEAGNLENNTSARSLCAKDALTDEFGWTVQAVLAWLAFTCLVLKRFCEPSRRRRSWLIWFYDTSKQGMGSLVIHFANLFLASFFSGDPCTWYIVCFLLDSSVGLLVIYAGIRSTVYVAEMKHWKHLYFGEYGTPPSAKAWIAQSVAYMIIMVFEKILITALIQLKFWDSVRDLILAPIEDPKVATTVVLLIIPFFINVLMFWVTDNFLMKKPSQLKVSRKKAVRYQKLDKSPEVISEDSDAFLSEDEHKGDFVNSSAVTLRDDEELLGNNRTSRRTSGSVV